MTYAMGKPARVKLWLEDGVIYEGQVGSFEVSVEREGQDFHSFGGDDFHVPGPMMWGMQLQGIGALNVIAGVDVPVQGAGRCLYCGSLAAFGDDICLNCGGPTPRWWVKLRKMTGTRA